MLRFLGHHFELLPWVFLHWKKLLIVKADADIRNARLKDFIMGKGRWLILDDVLQKLYAFLDVLAVVHFLDGLYLLVEVVEQFGEGRYFILTPFIVLPQWLVFFFYFEDEVVEAVNLLFFYL